jgi:hypothetical protein
MGLDWEPLPHPKRGHERRYAELLGRIMGGDLQALESLREVVHPVFETLGAPRVGSDAAAEEWLRAKVRPEKLEKTREQLRGYYVLDLLPPCDGFPQYSFSAMSREYNRYSFRAQTLIDNTEDILGRELVERAFEFMVPDELRIYASDLDTCADHFMVEHCLPYPKPMSPIPSNHESLEFKLHVLFSAARWCEYWAKREHGLFPG